MLEFVGAEVTEPLNKTLLQRGCAFEVWSGLNGVAGKSQSEWDFLFFFFFPELMFKHLEGHFW